ncbi:MAG: tRNA uridine-5-carboxymethylaminomethyl(34) synthesis GTPase MnmE [Deltaproteobacteria bacterium]|nr:tRNA uridine-5-carboxymethylaminomethyl(34) synthesis GTPase MnmE [Deltaproteobacteria bacterium]
MDGRGDTIAAIATARGEAALGIVRVSGPAAAQVLERILHRRRAAQAPRRIWFGRACHPVTGEPIDDVLCFFCPGPDTATGEDTAEIQGHGGPLVMARLLEAALAAGARPAGPGEFTFRAFLNGRIDLTQAEAVMELIGARSEKAARLALAHLEGGLGEALSKHLDRLVAASAQVEASLDFPDEDLPLVEVRDLADALREVARDLARSADSFALGSLLTRGAIVAIVGPPNAGKSSLLNALSRCDRALVDHEPGTTRDPIEAHVELGGIPLTLIDTAGLRPDPGRIEARGMERTKRAARGADLVLLVLDGADGDGAIGDGPGLAIGAGQRGLVAVNKKDLPGWRDRIPAGWEDAPRLGVSVLKDEGLPELVSALSRALCGDVDPQAAVLTTRRQHAAVSLALRHVECAVAGLERRADMELVAADLRWGRDALADLLGRSATDEVVAAIFSTFCLGK